MGNPQLPVDPAHTAETVRGGIVRSNALALPLRDGCVDLIVTSPPYFSLRSYQDDGGHYAGQIGSEKTPAGFVDDLIEATREMVRVLKPTGSIFVNLGDKYSGSGGHNNANIGAKKERGPSRYNQNSGGIPAKSLMGLPWRYANAVVDRLGLILRRDLIWHKPNCLPESVTDRCRTSHEYWFHFVKQSRYFSAIDELRELHKFPGSVWMIPSEPLLIPDWAREKYNLPDHFAAFSQEWPRRLILGWSPVGICTVCDEARRPVVEKELKPYQGRARLNSTSGRQKSTDLAHDGRDHSGRNGVGYPMGETVATITGYACDCEPPLPLHTYQEEILGYADTWTPPPTTPAVVLDPFGGTGTVAMVARALGRIGLTGDLSSDYCRLARWRIYQSGHAAKSEDRTWRDAQGAML